MADRRYWDTAAFLGILNEEDGRVGTCSAILDLAKKGDVEIYTSAFTLTEVLWPKGRPAVKARMREKRRVVRDFFKRSTFTMVQVDRRVAELAQEVVWEHNVKPKDAIHVASAILAGVTSLETYDGGLLDLERVQAVRIREPHFEGDSQIEIPGTDSS